MRKSYFTVCVGMLSGLFASCSSDSDSFPSLADSNVIENRLEFNSQEDCKSDVSWAEACKVAANSYNGRGALHRTKG